MLSKIIEDRISILYQDININKTAIIHKHKAEMFELHCILPKAKEQDELIKEMLDALMTMYIPRKDDGYTGIWLKTIIQKAKQWSEG